MKIAIHTRDGTCPAYVYRPNGNGPWPGVLVFMDGIGIRPAMLDVGERLAQHGYFVLLPDLYYRSGPYEPMNPHTVGCSAIRRRTTKPAPNGTGRRSWHCSMDAVKELIAGRNSRGTRVRSLIQPLQRPFIQAPPVECGRSQVIIVGHQSCDLAT
jgi:dienelactone hydrolase